MNDAYDCKHGNSCYTCHLCQQEEIDRLKRELKEARATINDLTGKQGLQTGDLSGNSFEWRTKFVLAELQLAEARAEVERLSALTGEWCKTAEMYRRFETKTSKPVT